MKHAVIVYPGAEIISNGDYRKISSNKLNEVFTEEKKPAQKENADNHELKLPAPFYDELHFANYE